MPAQFHHFSIARNTKQSFAGDDLFLNEAVSSDAMDVGHSCQVVPNCDRLFTFVCNAPARKFSSVYLDLLKVPDTFVFTYTR